MTTNQIEQREDRAVRANNRLLRKLVKRLRQRVQTSRGYADAIFVELCDSDPAAKQAMGELWGSGEFDCGPQDYDHIVKRSIEAVIRLKEIEGHTNSHPAAEIG